MDGVNVVLWRGARLWCSLCAAGQGRRGCCGGALRRAGWTFTFCDFKALVSNSMELKRTISTVMDEIELPRRRPASAPRRTRRDHAGQPRVPKPCAPQFDHHALARVRKCAAAEPGAQAEHVLFQNQALVGGASPGHHTAARTPWRPTRDHRALGPGPWRATCGVLGNAKEVPMREFKKL